MNPESNSITLAFNQMGICSKNAAQTQAMMYNKKNYCTSLRCLDCGIGKYILKKNGDYPTYFITYLLLNELICSVGSL